MKEFKDFIYSKNKNGITIVKYNGKASAVKVPQVIEDLPVTIIGQDAFRDCTFLNKIALPESIISFEDYSFCNCGLIEFTFGEHVIKIGRHAFYNCRELKTLHLPGTIRDIEDGAFKNCEKIDRLYIKAKEEALLSLKYILNSLSQNVWAYIEYDFAPLPNRDKPMKAALVFPKDAVFYAYYTTRLNDQTRFGIGNQYHYCIGNGVIDYSRYDSLFLGAKNELEANILCEIALNRIMYPYELEEVYKERYLEYVKENMLDICKTAIYEDKIEVLSYFMNEKLIQEETLKELLDYGREYKKTSVITLLLSYQNQHFNKREMTFTL